MDQSPVTQRKRRFSYFRFVILVMSMLFLAFVQASVMAFNAAYVVLSDTKSSPLYSQYQPLVNQSTIGSQQQHTTTEPVNIPFDFSPSYLPLASRRYPLDAMQRSFTFAASFAGGLLGTFPMLYLLRRFGAHITMLIVGVCSSLLCFFTPQTISISFELFVALRFLSGFVTTPVYPAIGTIIEHWAAMEETGLFIAFLTAHMDLAPLFAFPVGALLAEKVSWTSVFYVNGLLCAVFTVAWLVFYRNDPTTHPMINYEEVEIIKRGKSPAAAAVVKPPYCSIFTSTAVWAVFITAIGTIFVGQFSGTFSVQYFTAVLGYSPALTGTLTIIPTIAVLPVKALTGVLSDRLTRISEVAKLRVFNSLACFLGALFFIVVIFVQPSSNVPAATALIMIPFVLLAFTAGGFNKAAVMISRQHSSFIFGMIHIFVQLALLFSSFIIPLLTPDNTFDQWKIVFIIFAVVLITSNTFFIIFAKAEPEEWAEMKMEFIQLSKEPRTIQPRQNYEL